MKIVSFTLAKADSADLICTQVLYTTVLQSVWGKGVGVIMKAGYDP